MKTNELKAFLNEQIPLSVAMGIEILEANNERAMISAPLKLNSNHLGTAFGGSLGALLIFAGYAWLFNRLEDEGNHCHILIQKAHTDYLLPVDEEIFSICEAPSAEEYEKFMNAYARKGIARMTLSTSIKTSKGTCCSFSGEFVAQKSKAPSLA
jgi:thioesterase domain-containing protein